LEDNTLGQLDLDDTIKVRQVITAIRLNKDSLTDEEIASGNILQSPEEHDRRVKADLSNLTS
jgi:hypothetical protein